jgi:P-type Ca2+ transporter type 2C
MQVDKAKIGGAKFWSLGVGDTAKLLDSDLESGLSESAASDRLIVFGRNTLEAKKSATSLKIFLHQLGSPLIMILIAAGVVTFSIGHHRDTLFILVAVIVNSILGFWQESKAERALSQLKTYLKQRARVIRSGVERELPADQLVPGDIIRLAQGDRVPADGRVIFVNEFQVDESVLTGESLPVSKSLEPVEASAGIADQDSMIFAGTLVTEGFCSAIVCRTDASTELGQIASLIARSESEKTPLQKAITRFSLYLSVLLGALTLGVFALGVFAGRPALEMFLTSVALAVSAIPEGLPISMTVILAMGVERMAKRKGVVRKLLAAEALGSTTVILTDKTGTLTLARMRLSRVVSFGGDEELILARALTNTKVLIENPDESPEHWRMSGRIMETTLVRSAALRGFSLADISRKEHVIQSLPFSSVQKFSASLIREEETHLLVLFGAPDLLLVRSGLSDGEKAKVLDQINSLASSGERVLGLATKKVSPGKDYVLSKTSDFSNLSFDGLVTFRDPVRKGIGNAIGRLSRAGIKTVIMTGDHQGTAVAVAREIGLAVDESSVIDAPELVALSDNELGGRLPKISVISRVTPFDKLRVVKLFQVKGEVVAMTGDGVNDAPSIKEANVGIAMGSGTEVAQSVADLVLLDDNFETIVAAVEEGRQILGNIRKVLVYLLSNVADGLVLVGGSLIFGVPLPLSALQILWVNFFSDSFPAIAFAFERDSDALAHKRPDKNLSLFDPLMRFLILVIGLSTSLLLFAVYYMLLRSGYAPELVHTFTFAAFGTYTLLVALSVRSLDKSIFSYPIFANRYLTAGIAVGFCLMALAIYLPLFQSLFGTVALPFTWVIAVLLVGVVNIVLIELSKHLYKSHN